MALTNAERQKKWREDHKYERKQKKKEAELAVTELRKSRLRDIMLEILRERYEDEYHSLKREAEARLKP